MIIGIAIVVYAASIVFTVMLAKKHGRDVFFWTALAITIGPFVLPFLLFMRPKSNGV